MGLEAKSHVSLSHEIQCVCVLTEQKRVPLSLPRLCTLALTRTICETNTY